MVLWVTSNRFWYVTRNFFIISSRTHRRWKKNICLKVVQSMRHHAVELNMQSILIWVCSYTPFILHMNLLEFFCSFCCSHSFDRLFFYNFRIRPNFSFAFSRFFEIKTKWLFSEAVWHEFSVWCREIQSNQHINVMWLQREIEKLLLKRDEEN